jgi:hypothetical protein
MTRAWAAAVAVLVAAGPALAGSEQIDRPTTLVDKLALAIERGDEALARAQFTPDGFDRGRDSGASFYYQAVAKQFALTVPAVIEINDRAAITVDVARNGKVVDRVFFYAIRDGLRRWRIGAVGENKYFGQPFVNRRIGIDFDARALPPTPALNALAAAMLDASRGQASARRRIETELVAPGRDDALAKLTALKDATFVSSHAAAALGCAALHFRARREREDAYAEELSFVLIQRDQRWEIADASYGAPSTTDMLRAWTRSEQAAAATRAKSAPAGRP